MRRKPKWPRTADLARKQPHGKRIKYTFAVGKAPKIEVLKDEKDPIPAKVFQRAIVEMSEGYKAILGAGVKKETIAVLIKDKTGISKAEVHRVLDSLESLRKDWLDI